jgi:hypothetical protein
VPALSDSEEIPFLPRDSEDADPTLDLGTPLRRRRRAAVNLPPASPTLSCAHACGDVFLVHTRNGGPRQLGVFPLPTENRVSPNSAKCVAEKPLRGCASVLRPPVVHVRTFEG